MSEKIVIDGSGSLVDIWLLEAILDEAGEHDFHAQQAAMDRVIGHVVGPAAVDVVLTVNGHEVPFVKVAHAMWNRAQSSYDSDVQEKAKQLVSTGGLSKIMSALESAEWQIERALQDAFKKEA